MGLLMMTATIGGLILAAILLAFSFYAKMIWLRKFVLGAVGIWFVFYTTTLLGVSLASREKTLELNQPKEFCGFYLDCHLHAAVGEVRKTKTIGDKTANGEFYIVKVKIFSDARRAELGLITPEFQVVDARRRSFPPVENLSAPPEFFEQKVPAGDSFAGEIVFDLPQNIENPRLDICEGYGIDHLIEAVLIGDEDSFLHKRTFFKLEPQTANLK